jgi:hypothetical protein
METTEQTTQENPAPTAEEPVQLTQLQANTERNTLSPNWPTGTIPAPPAPPANLEAAALAVAEAGAEALTAAVETSHAAPAPASAENQQLLHHEGLLNTLLDKVHEFALFAERAAPLLALVERASQDKAEAVAQGREVVGREVPDTVQGAHTAARVAALEGFALDLVASLGNHFSGKLNLPIPPAA